MAKRKPSYSVEFPVSFTYSPDDEPAQEDSTGSLYDESDNAYDPGLIKEASEELRSFYHVSKREINRRIYVAGLEKLMENKALEGHKTVRDFVIARRVQQIQLAKNKRTRIQHICDNSTEEEWQEFCKENDIKVDDYMPGAGGKGSASEAFSWNVMAGKWLDALLSDHEEHDTTDIMRLAQNEGVVKSENDWKNLKVLASRRKYTARDCKGRWRISAKASAGTSGSVVS